MKRICKRCNADRVFEVPIFTQKEKEELFKLKKISALKTTLKLRDKFELTLIDTKFIVLHINSEYGKCNRCSFDALDEEYVNCPKCKALNFNWDVNKLNSVNE